jgi:hypothetical protein
MPKVSILLVYETPGGSPLTIARVADTDLINRVAQAAIGTIESRAEALSETDRLLGELERAEAGRLRKILSLLIPGFKFQEQRDPSSAIM